MIPEDWKQSCLSEISDKPISYGIVQAGPHIPDGVPYLKSSDVGSNIDATALQRTCPTIHHRFRRSAVHPGDIVFSLRGNIAECSIVPTTLPEANLTQGTARISVCENHSAQFVRYQLSSQPLRNKIAALSKGSTFREITLEDLRNVQIILPPRREQDRIAEILSTWDRAIEATEKLIANSQAQKKALMQQLLTGKKRLPDFSGGWAEKTLDAVFEFLKGQGLSRDSVTADGALPCILYGELYTRYPEVIGKVVGRTDTNEGVRSCTGDVLIPASTTTTGIDLANATALLQSDVRLGGDINILRPKDPAQSAPFFAYLLTHIKKLEIASRAQGSTIVHLSGSALKPLLVRIPYPDEQHAIAEIVTDADKEISALQAQLTALRQEKSALMQQLLTGNRRVKLPSAQEEAA